ncbi:response regulator [Megasphaera sp.]|uniref:response regulator n=1 Tax=Megasphaera sp. TaxID=2023260 RepID=UPI0040265E9B
MVRIAICDDLQEQLDIIQKAVQQYFHDKKEPTEVFTYNNAMDFVDAFEKEGNFDIVLLDICMPGLLGTDIAAEMRASRRAGRKSSSCRRAKNLPSKPLPSGLPITWSSPLRRKSSTRPWTASWKASASATAAR